MDRKPSSCKNIIELNRDLGTFPYYTGHRERIAIVHSISRILLIDG